MKIFGREFKLFNYTLDGKGVEKKEEGPKNLINFFPSYFRKFGQLVTVNLFMVFGNFPVFFALFALSGNLNDKFTAPINNMYSVLHGAALHGEPSGALMALDGVLGVMGELSVPTFWTNLLWWLSLLVVLTFGLVNIGTSYILRNMVKGEPIFMWTDFWYAIKRNLKQGIILGIIDLSAMFLIGYNILFYYGNIGSMMFNVLFFLSLFMAVIYFFMRSYMYIVTLTFELSIFKILKNALIFAFLGIGRNFTALIGIVLAVMINFYIIGLYLPVGIILPFVCLFSTCAYMSAYAAFPKIKQYMIDPYYVEEEKEEIEPIFKDRG